MSNKMGFPRQLYHSLWMGWTLVSLGGLSFAHIAHRTGEKKWYRAAVVYGAVTLGFWVWAMIAGNAKIDTPYDAFIGLIYLFACVVSVVHAFFARHDYLQLMAAQEALESGQAPELRANVAQAQVSAPHKATTKPLLAAAVSSKVPFGRALLLTDSPPTRQWDANDGAFKLYQRMGILHLIATGPALDATAENADLFDELAELERAGLVEIDVARAAYGLSVEGKRSHDGWLTEAYELIRRYDIYGDVDLSVPGAIRFGTGLGRDMRVPVYELDHVSPFKARFLVGMADREWAELQNWWTLLCKPAWYAGVFEVVETAPSIQSLTEKQLARVKSEGNQLTTLRAAKS